MPSSLLFVRFHDRSAMDQILDSVSDFKEIQGWEATEGHFQLSLSLKSSSKEAPRQLGFENIGEVLTCPVGKRKDRENRFDPNAEYSYFLIDALPDLVETLWGILEHEESIVRLNQTGCTYNLIAVARALGFDDLDRFEQNRLASLDGVRRVRQLRILKSWTR